MPILFIIVFVGIAGFGILFPLLQFLGLQMGVSVSSLGIILAAYSVGQLLGGPLWGRLSDTYGRRPILIWSTALSALSYVMLAYAYDFYSLLLVRFFSGIMAGNVSAAFAYATDISDNDNRAKYLGWVSAAFAMGFFLGPMIGGSFAGNSTEEVDFFMVSMLAAGMMFAATLAAIVFLKESLPVENRKTLNLEFSAPDLGSLKFFLGRRRLLVLVLLSFLVVQAGTVNVSVLPLWIEEYLALGPRDVSYIFGYIGFLTMVMHGGAVAPAVKFFGEANTLFLSLVIYTAALLLLSVNSSLFGLLFAMTLLSIGFGIFTPALNSMVSKTAAPNERGAVMGFQQSAASLARITGPAGLVVYDLFAGGSAFLTAAITLLPAVVLAFWIARRTPASGKDEVPSRPQG